MSDDTPPIKRGRGRPKGYRKPTFPVERADSLALAAATGDPRVIEKTEWMAEIAPTWGKQIIRAEDLEILLTKIAGGQPLREACIDLDLEAVLVRKRGYDDREFGERLALARRISADHHFDRMLVVASDSTLPIGDRRLIVETLEKIAKVHNRTVYGDKVQHDVRQVTINLSNDDMGLT